MGDLVDRTGLRLLTPQSANRAHRTPVSTIQRYESVTLPAAGTLVYIDSDSWHALDAPDRAASHLAAGGVVAVVIDEDDRAVPADFVTACIAVGVPVYLRPRSLPFDELTARIHDTPHQQRPGTPNRPVIRRILEEFTAQHGVCAWLVLRGCAVQGSHPVELDILRKVLSRPQTQISRMPQHITALHLPLPQPDAVLALANPRRVQLTRSSVIGLIHELDVALRSARLTRSARRDSEMTLIGELVEANVSPAALESWAGSLGLRSGARVRAIAATTGDHDTGAVLAAFEDLVLCCGVDSICGVRDGYAYALIAFADQSAHASVDEIDDLLSMLAALFELHHGRTVTLGASSSVMRSVDDLIRALIDARHLASRQARLANAASGSFALPAPLSATLLSGSHEILSALDRALLQPIAAYDRAKGSNYLDTLRTFLALDCHLAATAAELGIHINTLRYRLSRIERLTGRGLNSMADRVDFYLALSLQESAESG